MNNPSKLTKKQWFEKKGNCSSDWRKLFSRLLQEIEVADIWISPMMWLVEQNVFVRTLHKMTMVVPKSLETSKMQLLKTLAFSHLPTLPPTRLNTTNNNCCTFELGLNKMGESRKINRFANMTPNVS